MTKLLKAYLAFATKNKEKLLEATSDYAYEEDTILNAFTTQLMIQFTSTAMVAAKLRTRCTLRKNLTVIKQNLMASLKKSNMTKH